MTGSNRVPVADIFGRLSRGNRWSNDPVKQTPIPSKEDCIVKLNDRPQPPVYGSPAQESTPAEEETCEEEDNETYFQQVQVRLFL